jgi:hypothetical protein
MYDDPAAWRAPQIVAIDRYRQPRPILSATARPSAGFMVSCFDQTSACKGYMKASDLGVLVPGMQEFVRKANIAEFRKLLATTTDKYRRRTLLRLLAEDEAKAPPPRPKGAGC